DPRPRRMDGHPALPVRALDDDLRHRRLLEVGHQRLADAHVLVQEPAVFALVGEPARIPGPVDAEPEPDRIDFLAHQVDSSTSRTTMVRCEKRLRILPMRPRPRGVQRFNIRAGPTWASATTSESTSS